MIDVNASLKTVLKRLKLSGLLPGLVDRAAYAQKAGLGPLDFLELALQDEIDRREHKNLDLRLAWADLAERQTFEEFDWTVPVPFDRDRVRDLFTLQFLERREDIIFLGPVGVGKTSLACALGQSACRAGHRVLFVRNDELLKQIHQSRADHSTERLLRALQLGLTRLGVRSAHMARFELCRDHSTRWLANIKTLSSELGCGMLLRSHGYAHKMECARQRDLG